MMWLWVWSQRSDESRLPHFIAADLYPLLWSPPSMLLLIVLPITTFLFCFECFVQNPPIFQLLYFSLCAKHDNSHPSFSFFMQNTVCDILVGWSCSGDWKPVTLHDGKSFWFSGLRKSWSYRSFQRWCLQATPCDWSTKVALEFTSTLWMHSSWWMHTMTHSKWLLPRCGERPGKSDYRTCLPV